MLQRLPTREVSLGSIGAAVRQCVSMRKDDTDGPTGFLGLYSWM